MKNILTWLLGISLASYFLLNFSSGIIGAIWLSLTGNFWLVVIAFIVTIIMPWIYSLAFLPTLLFLPLLQKSIESGNRFFTAILSLILGGYNNFILALWATYVFDFVVLSNDLPLIPALLFGYAIVNGPIGYMAQKEGPDAGAGTTFGMLFVQISYFIMVTVLILGGNPETGYAWVWLLLIAYTILTVVIGISYVPKKDKMNSVAEPDYTINPNESDLSALPDPNNYFSQDQLASMSKERDSIYEKAIEYASEKKQVTVDGISKDFKIGYSRAYRIFDHLVEDGYIVTSGTENFVFPNPETEKQSKILLTTLEAFGILARITEVNIKKNGIEYCIEIPVGSPLEGVVKIERDIASALASPTGKVRIQAPIPGRSEVGIFVPIKKSEKS